MEENTVCHFEVATPEVWFTSGDTFRLTYSGMHSFSTTERYFRMGIQEEGSYATAALRNDLDLARGTISTNYIPTKMVWSGVWKNTGPTFKGRMAILFHQVAANGHYHTGTGRQSWAIERVG